MLFSSRLSITLYTPAVHIIASCSYIGNNKIKYVLKVEVPEDRIVLTEAEFFFLKCLRIYSHKMILS